LLSQTFNALNKEAQFTKEMLGSGATQIRNANYASKGVYFQAFTSRSTGLERIGKLCLISIILSSIAQRNSAVIGSMLDQHIMVLHTSETGEEITDVEKASHMTGMYEAVPPYRQLYVVQVIRYWVELLSSLQYQAMKNGTEDVPFFSAIFALFYNADSYIKTRKTWDKL
jgi:hypothetical protein